METITYLILAGILVSSASAQTVPVKHEWKVTLKVVDEAGQPIVGAKAGVGYYFHSAPVSIDGLTDTNGVFVASHAAYGGELGFGVEKAGYYTTSVSYLLGFDYDVTKWNPRQTIILKKITNPIPMYAKRINSQPPDNGKPVGYDLEVGDWVGPHGKGINTDIIFTREYNRKSFQDYDYKLIVSFPNPADGIQEFTPSQESELRSPHEAPTNGYQPQLVRLNISHPGQKAIFDYNENCAYFFRVQTKVDEKGNIVSAHYGKIYGDFMQFSYYFNPTPNDRNVEFDPKQNLMTNLKFDEGVSQP